MLKRSNVRFEYVSYVLPDEECVRRVVEEVTSVKNAEKTPSKLELALRVMEWIKANVRYKPEVEERELHPCVTLRTRTGLCLAISILMASILRAAGLSESVVGVATILNKSEHPFKATHASVILAEDLDNISEQNYITILNPAKNSYLTLKLRELLATNTVVIVFNDKHSWIPLTVSKPAEGSSSSTDQPAQAI